MAVARLDAGGIRAWVESDDVGGQYPGIESRRGARLFVDPENDAAARAILSELPGEDETVQLAPNEVGEDITAAAEAAVSPRRGSRAWIPVALLIGLTVLAWVAYSKLG
ncbi:MAG: hypothetical protein VX246_00430 [Myxococcota bacterium]|nr:hypothetical protein [Myxococcota bacterium]